MIDPKATVSYAQYNEDIILSALLHDVDKGFYVDVGANYSVIDSVTKRFYEQGWQGINIEPIKKLHSQLVKDRPRDINLQLGAGNAPGTATLREYNKIPGHSTFSAAEKRNHPANMPYKDYQVEVLPLAQILSEHKVKHIHFLKIDTEGYEFEVVSGNDWQKFRPEVVCIEVNHAGKDWRPILIQADYKMFIDDGLNQYYVAKEAWNRTKDFAEQVVLIDHRTLKWHHYRSWKADSKKLNKLSNLVERQDKLIKSLQAQADQLQVRADLSLKDQPMRVRVKRSAVGLTTDWYKYKQAKKK